MKREIKFRGIYPHSGTFFYGYFVNNFPDTPRIVSNDSSTPIKIETLGQFTGLKDKNGVDIYEGDLIKLWDHYNEVFTSDCAEVIFSHHYVGGWVVSSGGNNLNLGMRTKDVEVVGNIHESPELLNTK